MLESYGAAAARLERLEREALLCRRYQAEASDKARWERRAKELAAEIRKARRLLLNRKGEIECKLLCLQEPKDALVLKMRYLDLYPYDTIAEVLGFSPRHIHRIHVRAVGRLSGFMDTD